jgi:hypothetical protein
VHLVHDLPLLALEADRARGGHDRHVAMSAVLYVAAKAPRLGFAKTRLGQAIGDEAAAMLYAAFLRDLAVRLVDVPFPVGWYITPEDAWSDLAPLIRTGAGPGSSPATSGPVLVQAPGDWATRQQTLFREAATRGETRTMLIASDSPHLDVNVIAEAFEALEHHDLVLGPTVDGGYYLIGMRGPQEVLEGVEMSTQTVLAEIVRRAEHRGLSTALVQPTFDIDDVGDLAHLAEVISDRDDLPATRAALAALGRLSPNGHAHRSAEDADARLPRLRRATVA